MQRPKFVKNKCLVIQGLRKGLSQKQFLDFINDAAGKEVNISHIQILSKEYAPWMTVALEMDNENYEILSDISIWDNSIGIRDYVGWRYWHGPRPKKLPAEEIKKSLCMQWIPDETNNV